MKAKKNHEQVRCLRLLRRKKKTINKEPKQSRNTVLKHKPSKPGAPHSLTLRAAEASVVVTCGGRNRCVSEKGGSLFEKKRATEGNVLF